MSSASTVVVTGASGLLGRAVMARLKDSGAWKQIVGTAFSRSGGGLVRLDLTDPSAVAAFIRETKPALLVHSAAQRFPDKVEGDTEAARRLNVASTEAIAKAMVEHGGRVLYISTDYVFDGAAPPYKTDDEPNPVNIYGQLKLEGEESVLKVNKENMVLRVPVLYGPVEYLGESAVTTLLQTITDKKPARVSDYEIRRPAHVDDIAKMVAQLLAKKMELGSSVCGVYQWSGREPLTKYGMVRAMAAAFKLDVGHVEGNAERPSDDGKTKRPHDSTMDTSRLEELGIAEHVNFAEGIKDALEKWVSK